MGRIAARSEVYYTTADLEHGAQTALSAWAMILAEKSKLARRRQHPALDAVAVAMRAAA